MDPTPEVTPEITPELTVEPTATATPDFYIEVTTEAGAPARIGREISMGDYWIAILLIAILISMWVMFLVIRLRR